MQEEKNCQQNSKIKETKSVWAEAYEWIDSVVLTVMVLLLVFTFLFRQVKIDGDSMYPTLEDGERVIISDVFYTPKYGDIIVISSEVYDNIPIIKRVIATEGQWVEIASGNVYVGEDRLNMLKVSDEFVGDVYTEEIIASGLLGKYDYPIQVPKNHVFVLGDNREVSLDSRTEVIGFVDCRQILGKALYRVYPIEKLGSLY
ncbi:MAG: signal peptidase I [Clostridia bacterium]|nr:signal peptidase I [Clostridia bacterium]